MAARPSPGEETSSAPSAPEPVTMRQLASLLETHRTGMKGDMPALIHASSRAARGRDLLQPAAHRHGDVGTNSERLTAVEATIESMQARNKLLHDRVEDLENRSRRSNLRIVTVPEGPEAVHSGPAHGGGAGGVPSPPLIDHIAPDRYQNAAPPSPGLLLFASITIRIRTTC
ncbi:hypothetical protein EYF80_058196 [Liparis tanakae]|uniref:Uncharacterized protein n=1 Tax=Liparis tanakae TaxID=230148 RepID=A0A4Z2ERV2_9TELE|nr:hypothetical protein EYF80_058196 [Liparis tanakae]